MTNNSKNRREGFKVVVQDRWSLNSSGRYDDFDWDAQIHKTNPEIHKICLTVFRNKLAIHRIKLAIHKVNLAIHKINLNNLVVIDWAY